MANTLNLGDGNWATKEDSLLGYNSENNNYKPLPFDFSRASTATFVNKAGLIETVGSNIPKIDFSNDAKGALLLDPQSTNLITYSEDLSQWSNLSYSLVESNSTLSPDGNVNADKLVAGATNGLQLRVAPLSLTSGNTYTFSTYVKNSGGNYVILYMNDSTSQGIKVDLVNETFVIMGSATNQFVKNFGNGWYQIGFTRTIDANVSGLNAVPSLDGNNVSFLGDGVNGVYLWGTQVEQGSYATSYIPTVGSAASRSAETTNGSGNTSIFNDSQGVLYVEVKGFEEISSDSAYIVLSSPTISFTNAAVLQFRNNGDLRFYFGGSAQENIQFIDSSIDFTENNKIAVQYDSNGSNYKLFVNGVSISRYSAATNQSVTGLSELNLSYFSLVFLGEVKDARVYNTSLTDAQLQALTQ